MTVSDPDTLLLAAIVRSSDDAVISHTLDGTIETWNPAAERMFGYSSAEAVGRNINLIVPPGRLEENQRLTSDVAGGVSVNHFETVALTRGGVEVPVSLAIAPIMAPGGQLLGVSRIARDISRQKDLEHAARHLSAIVDSAEDAIISKTLNGIVLTWNQAAERMFGYRADEIIGRSIMTIIPAERRAEEEVVLSRVRAGESVSHFETVRQRKDGSLIDISLSVSPIRGAGGEILGASKIARDISRQKSLERDALRLAAIVDSSEDAIVSKDLNSIVQTWNRAAERMFGYTAEEMIGRSIVTIIPKERLQEEDEVLTSIRAGRAVEHFETVRVHKDGTLLDISLTVSPIRRPDGTVIGASKIARNISMQRRLALAAEQANRVKDEFLAMLSHELRTPLNAVLGYTRMLRSGNYTPERQERTIETIERNANVLSQLVSDVLDVSTIVTGKVQLKAAACDLAGVVNASVDMVRPSADAKGIRLGVQNSAGALPVMCDSDRLQQVLWNLLVNAVKFTPAGGRVDVTISQTRGFATIIVRDTGVGISREALGHVFQRFWQGESRGEVVGGLGLGLALARHFTELHGGSIAAESGGEGQGAAFTVKLPLLAS